MRNMKDLRNKDAGKLGFFLVVALGAIEEIKKFLEKTDVQILVDVDSDKVFSSIVIWGTLPLIFFFRRVLRGLPGYKEKSYLITSVLLGIWLFGWCVLFFTEFANQMSWYLKALILVVIFMTMIWNAYQYWKCRKITRKDEV